jgi:hypothetical protein
MIISIDAALQLRDNLTNSAHAARSTNEENARLDDRDELDAAIAGAEDFQVTLDGDLESTALFYGYVDLGEE